MYNSAENEVIVHPKLKDRVSSSKAAIRLDVPPTTLADWRKRKIGPHCFKLGGRWVYLLADLDKYVEEQAEKAMETA